MASIGRNEPCPCASGKKYKRCCLLHVAPARSTAVQRAADLQRLDAYLADKLMHFAKRRLADDWTPFDDYPGRVDSSAATAQLFVPWSVYCYRVGDRPVVDWFLGEQGRRLAEAERGWLEAGRRAWLSMWEVMEVTPGERVRVTDLLTGEERLVHERSATASLGPRDVILARVVDFDGVAVFSGLHCRPLPPRAGAEALALVRRDLRFDLPRVSAGRLRGEEDILIDVWEACVTDYDDQPHAAPALRTADGEELLVTVDLFEVAPGREIELWQGLLGLEGAQLVEEAIAFVRQSGAEAEAIYGIATLAAGLLRLETTSIERADCQRRQVEAAFAGVLTHVRREVQSADDFLIEFLLAAVEAAAVPSTAAPEHRAERRAG